MSFLYRPGTQMHSNKKKADATGIELWYDQL
jgi:hypothetical protein